MNRKIIPIFLIVFVLFTPFQSFAEMSEEEIEAEIERIVSENGPVNFDVAILLINVGEINKYRGTYELDFWYTIISEDIDFTEIPPPKIDFTNGRIDEASSTYVEEHYFEERVRGTFYGSMDFRNFPFEKIILDVELEPVRPWTVSQGVFHVDPDSGVDITANVPGWEMGEPDFRIEEHTYEEDEETYSRYVGTFVVERSPLGSFMKTIFPVTIITVISLISFWIPENFSARIYLTTPTLLALVFLHMSNLEQLPPLGYLTIFDKIMVPFYALFLANIVTIGMQMRLYHYKQVEKAIHFNKIMRYLIPVIIIGLFGMLLPF